MPYSSLPPSPTPSPPSWHEVALAFSMAILPPSWSLPPRPCARTVLSALPPPSLSFAHPSPPRLVPKKREATPVPSATNVQRTVLFWPLCHTLSPRPPQPPVIHPRPSTVPTPLSPSFLPRWQRPSPRAARFFFLQPPPPPTCSTESFPTPLPQERFPSVPLSTAAGKHFLCTRALPLIYCSVRI